MMRDIRLSRRVLLAALAALPLAPRTGFSAAPVELGWEDLLPEGAATVKQPLGVLGHDAGLSLAEQQPASSGVRSEWNGKTVRIPGFVVPLKHSGTGVTDFILVPYVGACIHVPPPPANQLVLVTTSRPFEVRDLFEPVRVTGVLQAAATATELADIGYNLVAEKVEAYRL